MDPKLYKMKFVGFKEDGSGELKRSSPGGIKHHEVRELPLSYARDMWWELVDALPEFVLPDKIHEDSVFIEGVFVPKETFDDIPVIGLPVSKGPVDEILYDEMTVKSLKIFIEGRGGKLDRKWKKADLVVEARRLQEAMKENAIVSEPPEEKDSEETEPVDTIPVSVPPEDVVELEPIEGEGHTAEDPEEVSLKVDPDAEPEESTETSEE